MPIPARLRALSILLLATWPLAAHAAGVEVFVLAGQSNATAAGSRADELPADLAAPQQDVRFWFEEGPYAALMDPSLRTMSRNFLPLQFQTDRSGELFLGTADGFGPEIRLGRDLADARGEEVAIVKLTFNGTSLAREWNAARKVGLYREMRDLVRRALVDLTRSGDSPRLAGVFWVQGEQDATNEAFADSYYQNLRALIARLRHDFADPLLPFILSRLRAGLADACCNSFPLVPVVRAAQTDAARHIANTILVDTDDLAVRSDGRHYDSAAELELGRRLAAAFLAPPALSAGRVIVPEGNARRTARIPVNLSGLNLEGVSVDYATADGSARAGEDYQAVSGTLTFPPGVVTESVAVPILGDRAREPRSERFYLDLANPVGASIATSRGICLIKDDDRRP